MGKIVLAAAEITTAGDTISIELVEAIETPSTILLVWPAAPSVSDPRKLGTVANAVVAGRLRPKLGWPRSMQRTYNRAADNLDARQGALDVGEPPRMCTQING